MQLNIAISEKVSQDSNNKVPLAFGINYLSSRVPEVATVRQVIQLIENEKNCHFATALGADRKQDV